MFCSNRDTETSFMKALFTDIINADSLFEITCMSLMQLSLSQVSFQYLLPVGSLLLFLNFSVIVSSFYGYSEIFGL